MLETNNHPCHVWTVNRTFLTKHDLNLKLKTLSPEKIIHLGIEVQSQFMHILKHLLALKSNLGFLSQTSKSSVDFLFYFLAGFGGNPELFNIMWVFYHQVEIFVTLHWLVVLPKIKVKSIWSYCNQGLFLGGLIREGFSGVERISCKVK